MKVFLEGLLVEVNRECFSQVTRDICERGIHFPYSLFRITKLFCIKPILFSCRQFRIKCFRYTKVTRS